MIGPLLAHIAPCDTVELFIDQRDQSVEGGSVALAPRSEELGGFVVEIRRHDSFSGRMAPSLNRERYGTPRRRGSRPPHTGVRHEPACDGPLDDGQTHPSICPRY